MTTDPTDEELLSRYFEVMQAEPIHDLGALDERRAKAIRAVFAAGRESVAPRITREELARAVCNGRYPDIYPDIVWRSLSEPAKEPYRRQADAVLSALGMTEEGQ